MKNSTPHSLVVISIALPVIVACYFYIAYASHAWFWQDDFGFIAHYSSSFEVEQLFDFTNFGRFLSRNVYWHLGLKYFSYNAQYFYIFNFFIILSTSFLLCLIFGKRGFFHGFVACLFYFLLPSTIEAYSWLSNSQHILGHFFVVLFVYLFMTSDLDSSSLGKISRAIGLVLVLIMGFASNVFMGMVLSLPAWMLLTDKKYRSFKEIYFVFLFGCVLFLLFFYKLSGNQTGAYSTSYNFETIVVNLEFYFKSIFLAGAWLFLVVVGVVYALARGRNFVAWLFLASVAFFVPFAFFEHQRYLQYGALVYLFFLLGFWALLIDFFSNRWPRGLRCAGLILVFLIFSQSLQPSIRFFSQSPRGAIQRQQVEFLRVFDRQNPDVKNYCFRTEKKVNNSTGVKEWDIPGDWWFVGFGVAFSVFVNHEKKYELLQDASRCDVIFVFRDDGLEVAENK